MQKYDDDRYLESYIGQHGVLLLCSRCCIGGKLLSALLLCGVMGGGWSLGVGILGSQGMCLVVVMGWEKELDMA